ncbi:hypothetical protein F7642_03820 [Tenacibaculum finnmarkense genomovar ulcerans]|uniref:hypothetical protein n=1 Tax=Tenacibaculum finnmarkense TaxID=2781243 RepID=UPI00187B5FE3|nr:hypothetical protein [Tenacibaculum finnmarkense]MBE7633458.1 hypothetical protein [Tenacibaculum finnmarkense genomovar ulcerans]MCD8429371.1 hypothetical protein [Tenacibaculum finnmarkense genomovar ulcerans]
MQLTNQNIAQLYKFTQQHFVEFYDVQTELVDHLANDIEQIYIEKPTVTFEEARDISFKKFGIFGFMDILEEKQKQVAKKYRIILWNLLKQWFTLPKIIIIFSIFLGFYNLYKIPVFGAYSYISFYVVFFVFLLIKCRLLFSQQKQKIAKTNKKWLLENFIYKLSATNFIVLFSNISNIISMGEKLDNSYWVIGLSIFSTLLVLSGYITLILIPNTSEEIMKNHYPEYQLV